MTKLMKPLDSISQKAKAVMQQNAQRSQNVSVESVEDPILEDDAQNQRSSSQNKQDEDKSFNEDILSDLKSKVQGSVAGD